MTAVTFCSHLALGECSFLLIVFFKATVHKFSLFVAICHCVENLALQAGAELSLLRGLYSGMASARINLMF